MEIGTRRKGNVEILDLPENLVQFGGKLDLRQTFKASLEGGQRFFIINLTRVPYLDSASIGETVACMKRAVEKGGVVKLLVKPQTKTEKLLRLTLMDRILEIFVDEDEAVATFAP